MLPSVVAVGVGYVICLSTRHLLEHIAMVALNKLSEHAHRENQKIIKAYRG